MKKFKSFFGSFFTKKERPVYRTGFEGRAAHSIEVVTCPIIDGAVRLGVCEQCRYRFGSRELDAGRGRKKRVLLCAAPRKLRVSTIVVGVEPPEEVE